MIFFVDTIENNKVLLILRRYKYIWFLPLTSIRRKQKYKYNGVLFFHKTKKIKSFFLLTHFHNETLHTEDLSNELKITSAHL